ncbi:uncharacterized protein BDW43DRAFT_232547 [Aspergillus alliaceus]|uniref:uncharacterized protein n=1 Tax=Petromyces alliaceus TaxID=209559 RepID=UPI0012A75762|nr:uncharacterized protein BDW43DRAFT_232547 [Aspergillus alliaceus]KAB8228066.1 hypothetical protein BDW43DRAFT_232547 [Aspergillus alliaceus]
MLRSNFYLYPLYQFTPLLLLYFFSISSSSISLIGLKSNWLHIRGVFVLSINLRVGGNHHLR